LDWAGRFLHRLAGLIKHQDYCGASAMTPIAIIVLSSLRSGVLPMQQY
jgi:hypothetical protein